MRATGEAGPIKRKSDCLLEMLDARTSLEARDGVSLNTKGFGDENVQHQPI
jgi:hypothetical protein